jgi:hypothetical protein
MTTYQTQAQTRPPLELVLFAMAGTVTLVSLSLAVLVSPWFLLLTAFVGISELLFVVAGDCPSSVVLRKAFHLERAVDR